MNECEFFAVNNLRCVKKCCRNCKHVKMKTYNYTSLNGQLHASSYFYCSHPDIDEQPEHPGPVAEFDICDAFEIAELEH